MVVKMEVKNGEEAKDTSSEKSSGGNQGRVMCFWHGWSLWYWTGMSIVYSSSLLLL